MPLVDRAIVQRHASVRWPSWTSAPRTQLIAGAVGAVVGLLVAGYGLFTAQGTAVRGVPAEDAATVNGIPILRSDLAAQLQTTLGKPASAASPAERRQVLADLIREELMVRRGLELDQPSTDPDTRAALVSAVQAQIAVDATSDVPAEPELRRFYTMHQASYSSMGEMTVRDLVPIRPLPPGDLAAVVGDLRRKPLAAVLVERGLKDSGSVSGDELYFAARIHLGDRLFEAARQLADGEVAGPVTTPSGTHFLLMIHNIVPKAKTFEEARAQVYSDYKQDLEARLRDGEANFLLGRADIHIAPDLR